LRRADSPLLVRDSSMLHNLTLGHLDVTAVKERRAVAVRGREKGT